MEVPLALKLVICHGELENVNHGVLRDALVEVSGAQILLHWIGLKKLAYKLVFALTSEIPGNLLQ